jgi:hypothetical protein
VSEHAPYIAHRGDIAMLSPLESDYRETVEGLAPFYTSFNGIEARDVEDLTPLRFAGVAVAETPDDMAGDWSPAAATLQIGGIATIRNTGGVTIPLGAYVGIRLPDRANKDDMWHWQNPGSNEAARGVIKPITFPITDKEVKIAETAAGAAVTTLQQFGPRIIDDFASKKVTEGELTLTALTGAFVAGALCSSFGDDLHIRGLTIPIVDWLRAAEEVVGIPRRQGTPAVAALFNGAGEGDIYKRRLFEAARYLFLPKTVLSETVFPRATMGAVREDLQALKTRTSCVLPMLAHSVAQHGRNLNCCIIGKALKTAAKGESFDIHIARPMI